MIITEIVMEELGHVPGPRLDRAVANIIGVSRFTGLSVESVVHRIKRMRESPTPPTNYREFFERIYGR